eukprot:1160000-Pelagomonas_calceolata.AAC.19
MACLNGMCWCAGEWNSLQKMGASLGGPNSRSVSEAGSEGGEPTEGGTEAGGEEEEEEEDGEGGRRSGSKSRSARVSACFLDKDEGHVGKLCNSVQAGAPICALPG